MKRKQSTQEEVGFLFNVDILIKSSTNALAMQTLLELLNSDDSVADFRIKSGMELGEIIDATLKAKRQSLIKKTAESNVKTSTPDHAAKATVQESPKAKDEAPFDVQNWLDGFIHDNRLVRLFINKHGKHASIPCRILNYDLSNQLVSVYHVDEKQVYSFKLNEIDEIVNT
ncbi:hypothetical protein PASE110613_10150 [Paenibacillus sediminis]|uniref:WYL domain-containing protein n=1 Tax=Paenibacillus sediminis TaxID=664909 RepID=A0ABS4H5N6_9BACL|nr:hypothetical protein [Paenibacillus sediminis]MBP1937849.1 hypothetical protein [Paenibacillus sediminis]